MMPYHLASNPDNTLVNPDDYANGDTLPNGATWYVYRQTPFLDALWNDGEQPIEESFGLHAVELDGRDKNVPFSGDRGVPGGNTHPDKLVRRQPIMDALLEGYADAEQRRATVLDR